MTSSPTAVLGLGDTGMSCVRRLAGETDVVVTDTRLGTPRANELEPQLKELSELEGSIDVIEPQAMVNRCDQGLDLIVSPSIPLTTPLVEEALAAGAKLTSDIDLFLQLKRGPVIGVTGTNGKSTVVSLAGAMLENAGFAVGGNIGKPALELLQDQAPLGYVLELSSFQLERLQRPAFTVGALLNVTADHGDHHSDFSAYRAAKQRVFIDSELAVFNASDASTYPGTEQAAIALDGDPAWRVTNSAVYVAGHAIDVDAIYLQGTHNQFNVMAAACVAHYCGASLSDIERVAKTFSGLPHRTEVVATINGVTFINDSKATNCGATIAALRGLKGDAGPNVILLAGGVSKDADFQVLRDIARTTVKSAVVFGDAGLEIAAALAPDVPTANASTLCEAVSMGLAAAADGDLVVLSPACASFDMFSDYAARGKHFRDVVSRLPA